MKKLKLFFPVVALLLFVTAAFAQNTVVKGVVIAEEDGLPVIAASVFGKDTKIGTVTDIDGQFTLEVPPSVKILVISYTGMKTKEIPVQPNVKVILSTDSQMLEEVVVTGMQKMDKRLFTGSTTKVSADDAKIAGIADISRSLEGRAAGVSVQNVSGTFGTAPKIRVRGATSIYGSSKPLWVVDGVIMEDVVEVDAESLSSGDANTLISSAIAGLNSDDIESFDILKDGSATSIYGARAMAGVIVVTTKKGKSGHSSISYSGEYTMRLKPTYSTFNIMNSQDQMSIYQELQQKGYLSYAGTANAASSGVYGKMYELITQYDQTSGQFGLANTAEAKAAYLRAAEYRNTDWFSRLFSYSIQHNHSISMSGGTDKGNYYASLSVMDDPGWTTQSSVQRFTGNLNATHRIYDNLSLNIISNAAYRKQRAPGTLSSKIDAVNGEVKRDFDINPYSYALNTSRTLDPDEFYTRNYAPFNIFHELENNYIDIDVANLRFQGELKYKPVSKVEISVLGAAKYTASVRQHYIKDDSNQAMAYRAVGTTTIRNNNTYLYTDPDDPFALPEIILPYGGIYERNDNKMFGWDFRATATYNDTFAVDHIINLYGGMETNSIDREAVWFRGWGLQYDLGEEANYDYRIFKRGKEDGNDYYTIGHTYDRRAAFFGTATYSYKGRYSLNGTIRYEGSNQLGKSRKARWLPTWNLSAKWNVSDEPFMKAYRDKISHMALKASYSLTAERGPVNNSLMIIRADTPWRYSTSDSETILYISSPANPDLTYEKKHELNIGLELGMLDNRINFAGDWYMRNNFDLIGPTYTTGTTGSVTKYGNVASMKSSGFELSLTTTNIKKKDFSWTTNFIYSHTKNLVTELLSTRRVIDLVSGTGFAMQGYPNHSIFSIPFRGLNEEGLPTFLDQNGNVTTTGIYFQTSDPTKLSFLEYSGTADPTDVTSLGNTLQWKGLRLNVFLTGSFGNVIRLDPVFKARYNDLSSMPKEFNDRWVVPGDENHTTIPVIASRIQNRNDSHLSYAYNAYNYSTERIAKGDFVRLKEVSLSYDFSKKVVKAMRLGSLSLKLQATNLFLLYSDSKLNGQDPEFFNTGGVAVPMPKQVTMSLKIGL